MPFCYSPWTNIDISPQGNIGPCCKFRHEHYQESALNINSSSLVDYSKSKTLQMIKSDFGKNQWPSGCERCKIDEDNGIKSKRILDYERWKPYYDDYQLSTDRILTASIAFGNTCNLSCTICSPYASSRWQKDYKILHGIDIKPLHFYRQQFVDTFFEYAPDLIHLDIPGGEPFLSATDTQKALLNKFRDSDQCSGISLHYTTNVTIFPDESWWELWKNFKEIDIQLSIDGIGDKFEYLRFPAHWKTIVKHLELYQQAEKKYKNIRLSISHSVSAYNIFYLPEFIIWCKQQNLPDPWLGRVHAPNYLRPTVWHEDARSFIIDRLVEVRQPLLMGWIESISTADDSSQWENFKSFTTRLDQIRNLDFTNTFPEMKKFYEKKI